MVCAQKCDASGRVDLEIRDGNAQGECADGRAGSIENEQLVPDVVGDEHRVSGCSDRRGSLGQIFGAPGNKSWRPAALIEGQDRVGWERLCRSEERHPQEEESTPEGSD